MVIAIRAVTLALLATISVATAARADDAAKLDDTVRAAIKAAGDGALASVWYGTPGQAVYELEAGTTLPAASVIKTAILVELFAAHAGHLDVPLGSDAVVSDDTHAAMTPFSAAQRKEIRDQLTGATVRTVGAIMMGSKKASNAVYNAAASLAIASLGGPAGCTAKIHARDPGFSGLVVARYMLAPRTPADNLATARSLAAVLEQIATGKLAKIDVVTTQAIAEVMLSRKDALGTLRHKDGNLDNDPMVVIKTGYYARDGKPPIIFAIGATRTTRPAGSRDAAAKQLDKLADAIERTLRAATIAR